MAGLTMTQMQALMVKPIKGNAYVRDSMTGELYRDIVKPSQFGKFEGRMGTKTRSRKGSVRIKPNGYARYNDVTDVEVVMYRV